MSRSTEWRRLARWGRGQLRRLGVDVNRFAGTLADVRRAELSKVSAAIDVGANVGQWGLEVRAQGYTGPILSIEPSREAYEQLSRRAARDPKWHVARYAVGGSAGVVQLRTSANSVSSSVLEMLHEHAAAAPDSVVVGSEEVPLAPLDELTGEYRFEPPLYVKVDTQGYEREVLAGGASTIRDANAVEVELSLRPLYARQVLADELISHLYGAGFVLAAVEKVFWRPDDHHLLQLDGLFVRP